MPTTEEINNDFLEELLSDDDTLQKHAADSIEGYTRLKYREEGFMGQILPPMRPTDSQLSRTTESDMPVVIMDKEPDQPPAYSVPFATAPHEHYIKGPKYKVIFNRIMTNKFRKEIEELRTYNMDLRALFADNAVKDIHTREDKRFMKLVNYILGGARNATAPDTGYVQWKGTANELNRDSIKESLKVMPKTSRKIRPSVGLVNHITIMDILALGRDEVGGDLAQDMFINGVTQTKIMGVNWITTIKDDLVPDNRVYYFAEPKYLGVHFKLTDITMHTDRKNGFMIEWFYHEVLGTNIANGGAVSAYDFNVGSSA